MKANQFYKTTAWKWFRKYMLLRYSFKTSDGLYCKCSTSGQLLKIGDKRLHLGHYIKVFDSNSTNYATAFEETNVAPQCLQDNHYAGGKQDQMYSFLCLQHGVEQMAKLNIKRRNFMKLDKFTLDILAMEYKKKFEELAKIKGDPFK